MATKPGRYLPGVSPFGTKKILFGNVALIFAQMLAPDIMKARASWFDQMRFIQSSMLYGATARFGVMKSKFEFCCSHFSSVTNLEKHKDSDTNTHYLCTQALPLSGF